MPMKMENEDGEESEETRRRRRVFRKPSFVDEDGLGEVEDPKNPGDPSRQLQIFRKMKREDNENDGDVPRYNLPDEDPIKKMRIKVKKPRPIMSQAKGEQKRRMDNERRREVISDNYERQRLEEIREVPKRTKTKQELDQQKERLMEKFRSGNPPEMEELDQYKKDIEDSWEYDKERMFTPDREKIQMAKQKKKGPNREMATEKEKRKKALGR